MRRAATGLSTLLLLGAAGSVRAQLTTVETDPLRLIYLGATESYLVPHVGRTFGNALAFHEKLFHYEPSGKVTVLLTDFSDSGNAAASAVPRDVVSVQIAPLSFAYETMTANERMNTLMNHELVHVANMDQAAGPDRFFRGLFAGKVMPVSDHPETILYFYLTAPRVAAPRWYLEGIAVFIDTWMAGGIGRAQGAYDEMVFRSMVRDGSRFYDPLGLVSEGTKVDFQVEANSYLYGTRFVTYVAHRFSPETVIRWASRAKGSKAYYATQFRAVFGLGLQEAWRDWIVWERDFQQKNLEAIRQYPATPFKDLSPRALGSVSRAYLDPEDRKLYAAFNYPGVVAHVGAISLDDGSVEKIADIKGPLIYSVTSLAYDPGGHTIFFTSDNNAYRDLMAVDPRTKKTRMLIKDARVGDIAFNRADRSLWGIRHLNGICTLVRIPYPYKEWNKVRSWPYGETVYDLDVSPDGGLVAASLGEISGRQSLRVMEVEALLRGETGMKSETTFGTAIPSNFVFSPDGRYLYGSSYYTGVSNISRYEIATGAHETVSNCETGFFRPIPGPDSSLVVFRYTGAGFVPASIEARPLTDVSAITFLGQQLVDEHPVLEDWGVGSPAHVSFEPTAPRPYSPARSLGLESLYPVLEGYKDSLAYGLHLAFSDPVQLNRAGLTASYSPDESLPEGERLHVEAEYQRSDWRARFRWNDADFYDLFGPTQTSRKGYALGLGYERTLVYDAPRELVVGLRAEYAGRLDRLPDYQNVSVTVDHLWSTRARIAYSDVRGSLGRVDEEKGRRFEAALDNDVVDGRAFFRLWGTLDLGFALPLGHSSIWLRSSGGYSPSDRDQPFSNFFFGGFGNNWVDHGDEKRYRSRYSFPGLELNEVGGSNYAKTTLEWDLPPLRFRRLGRPGFYAPWARAALFAGGLATDMDARGRRHVVTDVGAQVDLRFTVLSTLDMTLSGGYALAFEDGRRARREAMVSLKVLK